MEKNRIRIEIESWKDDACEPEELERITYSLRDDLTELDAVEKVDLVTKEGAAPEHSKAGGDVITLGSLLVTLGGSVASNVIPNLANTLQLVNSKISSLVSLKVDALRLTRSAGLMILK